jgi:signal transduction histidine kinase
LLAPGTHRYNSQQARLGNFLRWLIACALAFGALEALVFASLGARLFGSISIVTGVCTVCFLVAQAQLRRGRQQAAAIIAYVTLLCGAVVGALLWPALLPVLLLLPIMALVIVLPVIPGGAMRWLLLFGWLAMGAIAIVDELLPVATTAPVWLASLLRISATMVVSGLLLLVIQQFSSRMVEMLSSTEAAVGSLQATQAELERTLQERERAVAQHRALEEQLAALSEATGALLRIPNQEHVLSAMLELARKVIAADAYAVWRVHPTQSDWRILAAVGLSEEYQQATARALDGTRASPAAPVVFTDVDTSPDVVAHRREEHRREGIRAMLVMPLQIHGELGGTLVFYFRQPHTFSDPELRLATALSHLAAAALSTAELYDAQRELRMAAEASRRDLAFLAGASGILATSLDYRTALALVAELAVPQLADWCGVYLADEDGGVEQLATAHAVLQPGEPIQLGALVLQAAQHQQPTVIADVAALAADGDAAALDQLRRAGLTSAVIAPLRQGERVLGALIFGRAGPDAPYTASQALLAQEVARRAAAAVEHARLVREAQEAVRVREQFMSVASHELRTPLTALLGYAELLQRRTAREGGLPERDQRALNLILEQGRRLNQLVVTLLDVSRIETGQLRLERVQFDLVALAQRVVEALQVTAESHVLQFQAGAPAVAVLADAARIEQVIANLVGNALKYSPDGGTVTVAISLQEAMAALVVADQGMGIPQEAIPHLFQRFYRASNVDTRAISGIGIGLYIVHQIVTLHGGSISVTSEQGVGSAFTVLLPLALPQYC